MAVWWQKTSSPPLSCVMNPKPFASLNHFTEPVAMYPCARFFSVLGAARSAALARLGARTGAALVHVSLRDVQRQRGRAARASVLAGDSSTVGITGHGLGPS